MSLRPMLWSVPSVDPVRNIVGSNGSAWMEAVEVALRERANESPDEAGGHKAIRAAAAALVAGKVNGPETGDHVEVVHLWAGKVLPLRAFDYDADPAGSDPAEPRMLTDGDWKHMAWEDYRELVEPLVDEDVARMVGYLCEGRPLAGSRVESGWSYYAWLDRPELDRLLAGLVSAADAEPSVAEEVDEFHQELLDWLRAARACGALWLFAS